MSEVKFQVSRRNRPRCPVHDRLLTIQTSRGPVGYGYCSVPGCKCSAKVVRFPIEAKRVEVAR
jgi:hypothetical protein